MDAPVKILFLGNDDPQPAALQDSLAAEGMQAEVAFARDRHTFVSLLESPFDLVIADYQLPSLLGPAALALVRLRCPHIPFIMLSDPVGEEAAVEMLKAGATDFVLKGNPGRLTRSVRQALPDLPDEECLRKGAEGDPRQACKELKSHVAQRTADLARTVEVLQEETARRLRAMEELRGRDQLLMQHSRQAAMGEMLGNIAHQWRQPLNTLGLIVQELPIMYRLGKFDGEYLEGNVEKAKQVIFQMSQTIDDFRNFFKPDKEKTPFKVDHVVGTTLSLIQGSLNKLKVRTTIESADEPVIAGYPNEFSQALLNILLNARDAFYAAEVENPQVHISVATNGTKAVVTVTDNAGGIPEEVLNKIFEPYFTTKGPDKGTGLGLFMAKSLIERNMNGSITAYNTADGAAFRIEI